jgi:hypothetical protein
MNSLFRITGNLTLRQRKRSGISDLIRPGELEIGGIPCTFPAYLGNEGGDELAPDSPHQGEVITALTWATVREAGQVICIPFP